MEKKINKLILTLLFIGIAVLITGFVVMAVNWMFDDYCNSQTRTTPSYCKEALK